MSLKFAADNDQLRPMGRQTAGVQGMKFRGDDELLAMDVVPEDSKQDLLVVTNEGFAKRTAISEYRLQGRNGFGVKAVQLAEGRGSLVGALIVSEDDQVMAIMKSGKVIRSNVTEVKRTGRTTQGVTLAKPDKGDEIISIARKRGNRRRRKSRRRMIRLRPHPRPRLPIRPKTLRIPRIASHPAVIRARHLTRM